jgi:hypothetical protein
MSPFLPIAPFLKIGKGIFRLLLPVLGNLAFWQSMHDFKSKQLLDNFSPLNLLQYSYWTKG